MTPPTSAGHADEETLALYALHREEVDAASAAHIAQCPLCQHEAFLYARRGQELDEQVYRVTCPSGGALPAFALQERDPGDREGRIVELHFEECRHCAEEVRTPQVFIARPASDLAAWSAPVPAVNPGASQP